MTTAPHYKAPGEPQRFDPKSASSRKSAVRQLLKNCDFGLGYSVLSHGLIGASLALAGAVWVGLIIAVACVLFDQCLAANARRQIASLDAEPDKQPNLTLVERIENHVVFAMVPRSLLAMAAPAAMLAASPNHGMAAAGLMIAANLIVFMVQLAPNLRLMFSSTCLIWLSLLVFGLWHLNTKDGLPVALTTFAYIGTMAALSLYLNSGQIRLQRLLDNKDAHAGLLAAALAQRDRDLQLREMLEQDLAIGFFEYETSSQELTWSPGVFAAYGRQPGTVAPSLKEQAAQHSAETDSTTKAHIGEMLKKAGVVKFYSEIRGQDGVMRQILNVSHSIADKAGTVTHIMGMVDDQTELRTLLAQSEKLERGLEAALLSGQSMVWDIDFPSREVNAFGAVSSFLRPDQDRCRNLADLFHENVDPADTNRLNEATKAAYKTGLPQTIEFQYFLGDNVVRHARGIVSVVGNPFQGKGVIRSFVTDISADMVHREALEQARAAAETANKAKSAFLANMSHEIRTPLNGIIATTAALGKTSLGADQREMIDLVCDSGESLERVLNDILDLARVESGRLEIEEAPFALSQLLGGVTSLFAVKADDKGLNFIQTLVGPENAWLRGDATRVRQILTNFLSNAIKFTSVGQIGLHVGLTGEADTPGAPIQLHFEVSDTGPGLNDEQMGRLFNRFEQIDASITRAHGGSGLGLSICRSLADLMGGSVSVRSTVGQGSVFSFDLILPAAGDQTEDQVKAVQIDEPREETLRILAADDHATNRRVLQLVLDPLGIDLVLCEDGQQALDAFAAASFDVVLMDLQMPIMDGLTAMTAMRALERKRGGVRTPIIAVSANAMAHHKIEAQQAGADLHVAKPFTPDSLIAGIEAALGLITVESIDDVQPYRVEG